MKQATIEIKRLSRVHYNVSWFDGVERDLTQVDTLVLLNSLLMGTIIDGCEDGDDIEIVIARYGKDEGNE